MKKNISRLIAGALVAATVVGTGTTSLASKKSFEFCLTSTRKFEHSAANAKSDNEASAYVTVTSHNLEERDSVSYCVFKPNEEDEVTAVQNFYGKKAPNRTHFDYLKSSYAVKGKKYKLGVRTNWLAVHLKGRWNS